MKHHRNTSLCNLSEEVNGVVYKEEWKDIKGYEGLYQISSFGRVKSFVVSNTGRIRKGVLALGYPQVQLKGKGDNTMETKKIHRLVGEAFIPNPNNLPEINHKQGNREDNRYWNLEWSSPSDNVKHAYRVLGKKNNLSNQVSENHYNASFKNEDILKMREMYSSGNYTQKQSAEVYNKKSGIINRILTRKRWNHI